MGLPRNSDGSQGIVDYSSRLLTNDNVRFEIALGNVYRFGHQFTGVAAGASVYLVFDPSLNGTVTGNVYKFKLVASTTVRPIAIEGFEGGAFSDLGTELIIHNFNRDPGYDASMNGNAKMYHTPTTDSSGNLYAPTGHIFASASQIGTFNITAPGDATDEYSAYLNPLYKYLWKFKNTGDAATTITISGRVVAEKDFRTGGA